MNRKIKILHLENSFKDSELIQSLVENGEIEHEYIVAENEKDFINIFETENIDIILSDYSPPHHNGNEALKVAMEKASELMIANQELIFQNNEKEKLAIELIAAKEKAEESDRLKSSFLANMSHEIRTPLNGVLGFAELLKDPELEDEQKILYLNILEKSGERLLNIINDIMCISKIESGQMEVSISEINLNEQMDEIFAFFKPEAEQKGIHISCKNTVQLNETFMKTDKEKFLVIFTNLVKNAIKFTNKGSIEFGFGSTGSPTGSVSESVELEFFVKDTGIGIHPDQLELVFERFRQASESVNRRYEGAGLGLSISKAFVEMLGGTIRIESEFGKGSVIYFTLPSMNMQEEKSDTKYSMDKCEKWLFSGI